ncbi:transcriptional regulator, GntR family [Paracoccus halophilus]|uniref:Transcriptional regulator, GntR family n=1 Tax=Paracoccus halophilus TaxID=376733 RepID=A0A1I0SW80_9RHOB|nr:PLP-dependent aminotransferase family protein [Paracoccus halophilus]SFA43759.1 transcriptional regulator, GntR family [Paracoccus halophilus]
MWSPILETGIPKPAAIVRALRRAIENGDLLAGARLPPHRELAHALGVNLSTVTRAMNDARREGLVAAEVGRGTFVMPTSDAATIFAQTISRQELTDLSSISPPPLGEELIRGVMRDVVADEPDIIGYPRMHHLSAGFDAVVDWFRWRNMTVSRDQVALTAGAQAALHAVLSCAMQPGEKLLVEEFTFPGVKSIAKVLGLRLHGVACDAQGLLPEALEQAIGATQARAIVAVPNMQNPTGSTMLSARRQEIARVLDRHRLLLIEDDVYGSLADMPPLAAEVTGDHVVLSSLSKTVAPALRFGFIAGSHPVVQQLREDVSLSNWPIAMVSLLTASRLILSGEAMRLARKQNAVLQERWQIARSVFPMKQRPATHIWLKVANARDFVETARSSGVLVIPGPYFATSPHRSEFIRASLCGVTEPTALREGLAVLSRLGAQIAV